MSIASQIEAKNPISTTEKSDNFASEFLEIPQCTIEDVDRAVFKLFDKDLPLLYTQRNDTRRVPIIFATGERFALIARKQPLRDRSKALILPIISIMRSGFTLGSEIKMATAPDIRHVIKRQVGKEDPAYQKLVNKIGLRNSDDLVTPSAFTDIENRKNSEPGRIATRRSGAGSLDEKKIQTGNLLDNNLGNNIYEIYDMPAPVYFMATYDITLWTQYTQEMNNLLSVIASENHFNAVPSYRIETEKGYYFVAYVDNSISPGNNFEDFSEEERIVRSSMTLKVPGYFLGQSYIGSPNKIRRYISAPNVSFETSFNADTSVSRRGVPSGNVNDYILVDSLVTTDESPTQQIGQSLPGISSQNSDSSIGGFSSPQSAVSQDPVTTVKSPFAGKNSFKIDIDVIQTSSTKQGEKTFREIV